MHWLFLGRFKDKHDDQGVIMTPFLTALVAHFKTQGDGFFCLLGLVAGGLSLYFGIAREEIGWKLVIMGGSSLLVSLVFLLPLLREGYHWICAFWRNMNPQMVTLELPSPLLFKRLEQLKRVILESVAREIISIKVSEEQTLWIDDFCFDMHLNKQSWCASVSLVGGGILFPIEHYRIAQKSPIKLPKRFQASDLISCILCWNKNQLYIFPNTIPDGLLEELMIGLLAPNEMAFQHWLEAYKQRLAEDFSEDERIK